MEEYSKQVISSSDPVLTTYKQIVNTTVIVEEEKKSKQTVPQVTKKPDTSTIPKTSAPVKKAETTASTSPTPSKPPCKIPCPTCSSKIAPNNYKQKEETQEGFTGNTGFAARIPLIGGLLQSGAVKISSIFDKKCPTCNGKGCLEDKTDLSKQQQAAAKVAEQEAKSIIELEAKLGPVGGNRHQVVVGDDLLEIGLGMNDSKSYKVIKEGQVAPNGGKIETKGTVPVYRKSNSVVGTNPLAIPGGHYHIKCSNKFSVYTGAQGIDLTTHGPVTIKGGITQIIGPEVTIGSSAGQVTIEGEHLQLSGKSIAITPQGTGSGQVAIQGTLHTSGNLVVGGGIHVDGDVSFTGATCAGKIDRTRVSSDPNQVTGPAQWRTAAVKNGVKDFLRKLTVQIADPTCVLLSPRGMQNLKMEAKALVKKALPVEDVVTGWVIPGTRVKLIGTCPCNTGTTAAGVLEMVVVENIDLRNFPHHHTLADSAHSHDMFVPNMKLVKSSEEVRKDAKPKESIAPVNIKQDKSNLFSKLGSSIMSLLAQRVSP
jgi:hypothetical protein